MKKRWLILLAVIAGVVAAPYYVWSQATSLPSWYHQSSVTNGSVISFQDSAAIAHAQATVQSALERVQRSPDGTLTLDVSGAELNSAIATQVDLALQQVGATSAVKAVGTTLQQGKIQTGMVIDMVAARQLAAAHQIPLERLVSTVPGLGDREMYVGIEGTPVVKAGQLQLDPDVRIQIGNLRLGLAEVAQQLGVSEADLLQTINQQLPLGRMGVEQVNLVGDRLQLVGKDGSESSTN